MKNYKMGFSKEHPLLTVLNSSKNYKKIEKLSNIQLRYVFEILKSKICNEKGYWRYKDFIEFYFELSTDGVLDETKFYQGSMGVIKFSLEYNKKIKKQSIGFNNFIGTLSNIFANNFKEFSTTLSNENLYNAIKRVPNEHVKMYTRISLKNQKDVKNFIVEIKELRNKYLICSDEDFFNLMLGNVYLPYHPNTIKKMYYID